MATRKPVIRKPGYSLTRRAFWISFVFAWAVILAIVAGAIFGANDLERLAGVALPSMVALIAALLGIHRFAGSMDMRAQVEEDEAPEGEGGQP